MSRIPPLDPNQAARKGFKEPEARVRRFWKIVTAEPGEDGWRVLLDGRPPRTPAGHPLVLPVQALARLVAQEWADQGEHLEPATMPATRLAFTAIDRIGQAREEVAEEVVRYLGSDALCYFADGPRGLIAEQEARWRPWLDWAARELSLPLRRSAGVAHVAQPDAVLRRGRELVLRSDDFALAGLGMAVGLFGSVVLALAVQRGALTGQDAFELSRLDEDWQERQWGVDAEAAERTASRRAEAGLLNAWFAALRS